MDCGKYRDKTTEHGEDDKSFHEGIVVTATDGNPRCVEQLGVFLRSLARNSSRTRVVVHLVGCDSKSIESAFKENGNVKIVQHSPPKIKDMRGYMVCFRARAILSEMCQVDDSVAWFDVDVIVRSSLAGMWTDIGRDCIKVVCREEAQEKSRFQAGVFAIGNSLMTKKMVGEWENKIGHMNQWYADQLWLWKIWKKHSSMVKLVPMDTKWNNTGDGKKSEPFLGSSAVWHCKSSHFDHPTFQEEYRRYLT